MQATNQVTLGIQTYSLREMLNTPGDMVDKMIGAITELGIRQCEMFEPTLQPPELSVNALWASFGPGKVNQTTLYGAMPLGPKRDAASVAPREAVRQWRLSTPDIYFSEVARRFERAGIEILAFNFSLKDDCTDAEIDRGFEITRALNAKIMTASTTLSAAQRTVPFADKHDILVAMHNHSNVTDPNHFGTPESFERALAMSPRYRVNLDIGHFSAAGFDSLPFIRKHHARITHLHIKDRRNNDGPNTALGEGDTPIKAVLQLVKSERYPLPCHLEYEYAGTAVATEELRKGLAYVRAALA